MGGKDPEKQNGQSKVATEQAGLQGGGEDEGEEEVEEKERRRRRRNRDRDRDMDMDMDIRGFCKDGVMCQSAPVSTMPSPKVTCQKFAKKKLILYPPHAAERGHPLRVEASLAQQP
ncbi:hypothetical protein GX50_07519 [[Emmonsia] crescens]|uniref:Uncharacterized protein n=1 Tax=[Emmonsia] crescens TaxID=73230 RepID=A0A2B7Z728_9EURO|nr:hypothetical protein GX50_07519 [Emmonsia crescens]